MVPSLEITGTEMADVTRACELVGVSTPTLYRYFQRGLLRKYKVGGRTYVSLDDLRALIRPAERKAA